MHHFARQLAHGRQQRERFEPGAAFDHADALGDVLGIVADAFKHAADLQRGDNLAQVVGHRRTQRDDPHGELVDFGFQRVDPLVAGDHLFGQFLVTPHQRVERLCDRDFRKAAHLGDQAAQPGDVLIECLDGVLGHQPYLPVI